MYARKLSDLVNKTDVYIEFTNGTSAFGRVAVYRHVGGSNPHVSVFLQNEGRTNRSQFLTQEEVRSVRQLSPNAPAQDLERLGLIWVDQSVRVLKYGYAYHGYITEIKKARVSVKFRLKNGEWREHTFRAADVDPVKKQAIPRSWEVA